MGKDVSHGRGERLDEPEVGAGATGVDDGDTAGPQVSGDVLKELARGELERNVWLAIRVDSDQVERRIGGSQRVAAIGDDDVDVVKLIQRKVFAGDVIDLGVDLDARDWDRAVRRGELPGDRATRQPDQQGVAGSRHRCRWRRKVFDHQWRDHEVVPGAARQ